VTALHAARRATTPGCGRLLARGAEPDASQPAALRPSRSGLPGDREIVELLLGYGRSAPKTAEEQTASDMATEQATPNWGAVGAPGELRSAPDGRV